MSRSAWTWLGVLASLSIVAVTIAAALDQVHKTYAIVRAEGSLWNCLHHGMQCGATKPDTIEDAWTRREYG